MKWFQETTVWPGATANHAYLLNDSKRKMFAYVKDGKGQPHQFSAPIDFNPGRRTFREVLKQWPIVGQPVGETRQVKGSKGNTYTLTKTDGKWSCSCVGFGYRGKCKHMADTGH
jgi:hypothetical protein